jgi:16S rRNA (uracil1498-N3)-methyltransferase
MHLFFPSYRRGNSFYITDREYKHLKIRRVSLGEEIGVIHEGKIYRCTLKKKEKEAAVVQIKGIEETACPQVEITLYQSVTQNLSTMDLIVQKSVELGVIRLVPLITRRSFSKISTIEKRFSRWENIAREAMKQCKRAYPLDISSPEPISELISENDLDLLLDSFYRGKDPSELDLRGVKSVGVVVGPEGGFTAEEAELLRSRGFVTLSLKPHILRTETAAIVAVGIIANLAGS